MRKLIVVALLVSSLGLAACRAQGSVTVNADGTTARGSVRVKPVALPQGIKLVGDELDYSQVGGITFESNTAELSAQSAVVLNKMLRLMKDNPNLVVRIDGHTDSTGTLETNRDLSMARANAVRDWLVNAGIEPYRFSAVQGFGEERPKVILCEAKKGDPTVSPVKPDAPMPCVEDRCSREPRLLRPATRELCEAKVWSVNRRSEFHVVKGTETIAKP